jgi:hypothetical protein
MIIQWTSGSYAQLEGFFGLDSLIGNWSGAFAGGSYSANKQLILDSLGGLCLSLGTATIPIWNTAGRPATPKPGTIGFNTQTSALEVYDGSSWY